MKISLRKANAIQLAINEAIKGLSFNSSVSLNEFEHAIKQIETVRAEFDAQRATREKLSSALYEIRKSVATANADAGINSMLADVASLEKDLQFYNQLATKTARKSDKVIEGQMEKIRNTKPEDRLYGRYDTVDTGIFSQEDINEFKRLVSDIKKSKQKVQDALLELNIRTEVELSDATVATLTELNLV